MFTRPFRSKLIKLGWLGAVKEGSNESQSWRRTKDNAITALSDLVLLYQKLPQDKRDELYNLQNLKEFFNVLLDPYVRESDDLLKLETANYIIERSLNIFKTKHLQQNQNTQELASIVIDYLDRASGICRDITYKEKMSHIDLAIPKEKLIYLGSWNELAKRDRVNLYNFIIEAWDLLFDEMHFFYSSDNEIVGKFENVKDRETYFMRFILNNTKDKADLLVYNDKGFDEKEPFIVKPKNDDYLIYYGKSVIEKIKAKGISR